MSDVLTITATGGYYQQMQVEKQEKSLIYPINFNLINAKIDGEEPGIQYYTNDTGHAEFYIVTDNASNGDIEVADISVINAEYSKEYIEGITIDLSNPTGNIIVTVDNTWYNNTTNKYRVSNEVLEITLIDNNSCTISANQYAQSTQTTIDIKDGITSIGGWAFYDCSSLTNVIIPDSVSSIGNGAFESCINLINVYYTGSQSDWNNINIGLDNDSLTNATKEYNYIRL